MRVYAYLRKLVKSASVTLSKTTNGTEVYTCWQGIPHADDSFSKKPVASNAVAMWFKQFVSMPSGLGNIAKFKNIWEVGWWPPCRKQSCDKILSQGVNDAVLGF